MDAQAGFAEFFGGCRVSGIDYQEIEKVLIIIGNACDGTAEALRSHEYARRAVHGGSGDDWAHGRDAGTAFAQRFANTGDGENRTDAGHRIARRKQDKIRRTDRLDYPRRRLGIGRAGEAYGFHRILIPALDRKSTRLN